MFLRSAGLIASKVGGRSTSEGNMSQTNIRQSGVVGRIDLFKLSAGWGARERVQRIFVTLGVLAGFGATFTFLKFPWRALGRLWLATGAGRCRPQRATQRFTVDTGDFLLGDLV